MAGLILVGMLLLWVMLNHRRLALSAYKVIIDSPLYPAGPATAHTVSIPLMRQSLKAYLNHTLSTTSNHLSDVVPSSSTSTSSSMSTPVSLTGLLEERFVCFLRYQVLVTAASSACSAEEQGLGDTCTAITAHPQDVDLTSICSYLSISRIHLHLLNELAARRLFRRVLNQLTDLTLTYPTENPNLHPSTLTTQVLSGMRQGNDGRGKGKDKGVPESMLRQAQGVDSGSDGVDEIVTVLRNNLHM